jgi:hypothetical protein
VNVKVSFNVKIAVNLAVLSIRGDRFLDHLLRVEVAFLAILFVQIPCYHEAIYESRVILLILSLRFYCVIECVRHLTYFRNFTNNNYNFRRSYISKFNHESHLYQQLFQELNLTYSIKFYVLEKIIIPFLSFHLFK